MGKKNRAYTYQHPKKKRPKIAFKSEPEVVINRVKRVLEPKVPDDIDIDKLGEMYLIQGIKRGVQMTLTLPQQLTDAVVRGDLPTKVDTTVLLKQIKQGLESSHRAALDHLEKRQTDLEATIGYRPIDEEGVVEAIEADQFIRIITIPKEAGGGFCAEMDPQHRGLGATKREALQKLAEQLGDDD